MEIQNNWKFKSSSKNLENLLSSSLLLLNLQLSSTKTSLKNALHHLLFSIILFSCFAFIILISVYFIMEGTTLALTEIFEGKLWLAHLITGIAFLCFTFFLFFGIKKKIERFSIQSQIDFYKRKYNHLEDLTHIQSSNYKSEADFIFKQSEFLKEKIKTNLKNLTSEMKDALNIQEWTETYPYQSTGISAILGFLISSRFFQKQSNNKEYKENIFSQNNNSDTANENKHKNTQTIEETTSWSNLLSSALFSIGHSYFENNLLPLIQDFFNQHTNIRDSASQSETL